MRAILAVSALLMSAPCWGAGVINWDGDPLLGFRELINDESILTRGRDVRLAAADTTNIRTQAPPVTHLAKIKFKKIKIINRRTKTKSPPTQPTTTANKSRTWRQITPNIPIGPRCPNGADRPCAQERAFPAGSPPRGGYYYGYFRGQDGKLIYGKLYLPHYGAFDGFAHNDPPARMHGAPTLVGGPYRLLVKKPALKKRD